MKKNPDVTGITASIPLGLQLLSNRDYGKCPTGITVIIPLALQSHWDYSQNFAWITARIPLVLQLQFH